MAAVEPTKEAEKPLDIWQACLKNFDEASAAAEANEEQRQALKDASEPYTLFVLGASHTDHQPAPRLCPKHKAQPSSPISPSTYTYTYTCTYTRACAVPPWPPPTAGTATGGTADMAGAVSCRRLLSVGDTDSGKWTLANHLRQTSGKKVPKKLPGVPLSYTYVAIDDEDGPIGAL